LNAEHPKACHTILMQDIATASNISAMKQKTGINACGE
jgi:hypothetical protein